VPVTVEMEQAITRRISRDREPLKWRRIRHLESGREGYIEQAWGETHGYMSNKVKPPRAEVVWDGTEPQYGGWRRSVKVDLSEIEILDPPALESARIRKVLFRGHKEQVAERMRMLGPAPESCERFIEFDPQPMAYRRWRIVHIGPPLTAEALSEIPDQYKGAAALRKAAKDNGYEDPDPIGGW
jgi:hypothetical protein